MDALTEQGATALAPPIPPSTALAAPSTASVTPPTTAATSAASTAPPAATAASSSSGPAANTPAQSAPTFLLSVQQCSEVISMNVKTLKKLATAMNVSEGTKGEMATRVMRFCGKADSISFDSNTATFDFPGLVEQGFTSPAAVPPPQSGTN